MTNIFKLIFSKKTEQAKESVPTFNITETSLPKVDIEVTEISYEEFQSAITKERRLTKRHPPVTST